MASLKDLATKLPSKQTIQDACHLCGGKVVYRGFTSIECATKSCANYTKDVAEQVTADFTLSGDWFWALAQEGEGKRLEARMPANMWSWTSNTEWFMCIPSDFPSSGDQWEWRLAGGQ